MNSQARYILDTHVLWWYLKSPGRLSAAVLAVFRLAETGHAFLVVPAITIAEFYYLSIKLGQPVAPSRLLQVLSSVRGIELSALGQRQLERLDLFPEIPEMHDRLIAAESLTSAAPVLTRDETLSASPQIETIW